MGATWQRCVGIATLLLASCAHASDRAARAQGVEGDRIVSLTVSGSTAEGRPLLASVDELLGRLGLRVAAGPLVEGVIVARVSVELGRDLCVVSVSKSSGPVLQVRRVTRGPSTAVTIEAVAHVIQSSVEELIELDRRRVPARPPDAQPESEPPTPPELPAASAPLEPLVGPKVSGPGVELGAYMSGRSFTTDALVVMGAGLITVLRFSSLQGISPRLAASFNWNGPFATSSSTVPVKTTTQTWSIRLLGQARVPLGTSFALEVGLGAGADVFLSHSESRSSTLTTDELSADLVVPSAILEASVGLRARVSSFAEIVFALAGDVDLSRHTYVSVLAGSRTPLFQHWLIRPALTLGFSFGLWEAR